MNDAILDFLKLLQGAPHEWRVNSEGEGEIRTADGSECPLIALAKDSGDPSMWLKWQNDCWQTAGDALGLVKSESDAVAFTADGNPGNDWLRLALLACCRIQPIGGAA